MVFPNYPDKHRAEPLVTATEELLEARGESFHIGPSWTTDAIYRETISEVEQYANEGILTVEMEASAVFAVAAHRGVSAGAMFVVSDYLGPADWELIVPECQPKVQRSMRASIKER